MEDADFLTRLSEVVRSIQNVQGGQPTLAVAVKAALDIIPGCEVAGVTLVRAGGVNTLAATHEAARVADAWQVELGEGPAVDSLRDLETVYSPSLGNDTTWRTWGPQVASGLGLHSVVSFRLFTSRSTLGSLNLYSRAFDAFDDHDMQNGLALAAHVAMALAAEVREEQMHTALTNRTVIGQAEGILMERYGLDADRAFQVLTRISSTQNLKLHKVAEQLVQTGSLPADLEQHRDAPAHPRGRSRNPTRRMSSSGPEDDDSER